MPPDWDKRSYNSYVFAAESKNSISPQLASLILKAGEKVTPTVLYKNGRVLQCATDQLKGHYRIVAYTS